MIIPIKCVSCGNVLADKYRYYVEQVRKKKMEQSKANPQKSGNEVKKVVYYTKDMQHTTTPEAEVMDQLKLFNVCCRRIMMTHVDVE
jgi:DNA-directed RNA polymerase I, II, and III subunit RPABC5